MRQVGRQGLLQKKHDHIGEDQSDDHAGRLMNRDGSANREHGRAKRVAPREAGEY